MSVSSSPDPIVAGIDWLPVDLQRQLPLVDVGASHLDSPYATDAPPRLAGQLPADPPSVPVSGAYVSAGTTNTGLNTYAREELLTGARALLFRLFRQPKRTDLSELLANIPANSVSLHCSLRYPGQDPAELFRDLVHYLRTEGYALNRVRGSVDFDPLLDWSEPPFPPLIRLLKFVREWMPEFRVLQVNAAGFNNGSERADDELALAIAKGVSYLEEIREAGYAPELTYPHLQFALSVGDSIYVDAAKVRALRQLWKDVLEKDFGIPSAQPTYVAVHSDIARMPVNHEEFADHLAAHYRSAVLGRADLIFLAPANGHEKEASPEGRAATHAIPQRAPLLLPATDEQEAALVGVTSALRAAAASRYATIRAAGGFGQATTI